ncbi:hypothetical protein F220043C3_11670 [Enterocloster asparagiformis]
MRNVSNTELDATTEVEYQVTSTNPQISNDVRPVQTRIGALEGDSAGEVNEFS